MKDSTEVLLDELLKDYQTPEQILGENGILKQLTKRLAERALQAEMTHHLGYAKENLTGYKRPRKVEFVDSLPKSAVGKVLRKELRALEKKE